MTNNRKNQCMSVATTWIFLILTGALFGVPVGASAQALSRPNPAGQNPVGKPATSAGAEQPKFKGIWEAMNYKEAVEFTDVFFVTADEGWASGRNITQAGEGGFILHTRDAGQTWEVQYGDPQSATRSIATLWFIDKTHGWATEYGGKMLRTADGQEWEPVGEYDTLAPYAFTSPTTGISLRHAQIFRSEDGGATWKSVFTCQCNFVSLHFPSAKVGYAVSQGAGDVSFGLAKTLDGGLTWTLTPVRLSGTLGEGHVDFLDEQRGFVSLYKWSGDVYATADGGQTWRRPAGLESSWMKFADAGVGWSIQGAHPLTYTVDGGKHWLSRQIPFPASVTAFSLPRSDRGYVVGQQGMIYRYSVVPVSYQAAARSLDAPAMPREDVPCCAITAIASPSVVTARTSAGAYFVFAEELPSNGSLLSPLRPILSVGQKVFADFKTKQVSLDGSHIVGTIQYLCTPPPPQPCPPGAATCQTEILTTPGCPAVPYQTSTPASCRSGYYGPQCIPCSCPPNGVCSDGINGNGSCTSQASRSAPACRTNN